MFLMEWEVMNVAKGDIRHVFFRLRTLFVFLLMSSLVLTYVMGKPRAVRAVACPFSDGGPEDADGTVDGTITLNSDNFLTADAVNLGAFDCSNVSIHLTNNMTLTMESYDSGDTDYTNDHGVELSVINLTVDAGSHVDGDHQGYHGVCGAGDGRGPGAGQSGGSSNSGSGGGYGGAGGPSDTQPGGTTYGDENSPFELGSSGGSADNVCGEQGGGAIKIVASGTINNNGLISANGGDAGTVAFGRYGGAGSGGSVYLIAQSITGSGNVTANGGQVTDPSTYKSGAGGGGRVRAESYNQYHGLTLPAGYSSVSGTSDNGTATYALNGSVISTLSDLGQFESDGFTPIPTGGINNTASTVLPVIVDTTDSTGPKIVSHDSQSNSGSSISVSTTPSGNNRFLLVEVAYNGDNTVEVSDMDFNGQALTKVCKGGTDNYSTELWYL
jgi:hypothetical protein